MADVTMAHPDCLAAREGRMNTILDTPIRHRVVPALIRRELDRLADADPREIARTIEENRRYLEAQLREIEGGAAWTR